MVARHVETDSDEAERSDPPGRPTDIRFTLIEHGKSLARISNLEKRAQEDRSDLFGRLDEISRSLGVLNGRVKLVQGILLTLSVIGAIVAFFFHDQLQNIANGLVKLGAVAPIGKH